MFHFDRMYGELRFPQLVREALDCPGLLRLREVRMANIPFLSFPSFTGVTRYEHSLGVCHLANLFSTANKLDEKDKIELMLAGLYHDVATPPFGHAVEEVLSTLHGYDHEEQLRELIIGKSKDLGGQRAQLFLGRGLKLHKICQSRQGRSLGVDVLRIADLAAGTSKDPLGDVICSPGIDLDNVDNVIRAATAMGVRDHGPNVAENLARNFLLVNGRVCLDEAAASDVEAWKHARTTLYGMIFSSLPDFALQTMLKHALHKLATAPEKQRLTETDWSLTDDELIYQRLLACPQAAEIVTRIRLGATYRCLAFLMLKPKSTQLHGKIPFDEIERSAGQIYRDYIGRTLQPKRSNFVTPELIANAYTDKRSRSTMRPTYFMGVQKPAITEKRPIQWIFGLFTPAHRNWDETAITAFRTQLAKDYYVTALRITTSSESRYPNVQEVST